MARMGGGCCDRCIRGATRWIESDHGFRVGGEYSQAAGSIRGTLVEKLLTYGLGRGAEIEDGPQVRKIVRESAEHDYRFHSLIQAIVHSRPFLIKRSE